jgi:hypothetical protein
MSGVRAALFMYWLDKVGGRTKSCGTPPRITLGVDVLPSTEILNFLFE